MNVEDYCLSKLASSENYPFGDQVAVFKVGGKMFALTSPPGTPTSISLKCDPVMAISLRQMYKAVTPGYHLNKDHWNSIELNGSVPDAELKRIITYSYELVVKSLPKAARQALSNAWRG